MRIPNHDNQLLRGFDPEANRCQETIWIEEQARKRQLELLKKTPYTALNEWVGSNDEREALVEAALALILVNTADRTLYQVCQTATWYTACLQVTEGKKWLLPTLLKLGELWKT